MKNKVDRLFGGEGVRFATCWPRRIIMRNSVTCLKRGAQRVRGVKDDVLLVLKEGKNNSKHGV